MRIKILILILILSAGCGGEKCRKTVSPLAATIKTERLESQIKEAKSADEITQILQSHPKFAKHFFDNYQYPNDTILGKNIFKITSHSSIDTVYQESLEAFKDFDAFVIELQEAYGRLKAYYPQTKIPTLTTAISGLYKDIYIDNAHIMVGLDYYVGEQATYRPINIPEYISKRYDRAHLSSMIMRFVCGQYVKNGDKNTLLSEMVDHGKNYYLLGQILPCIPMNVIFGYTAEEWKAINENEHIIWANFVENKLLYETSDFTKQKFIGERPNIYEIGDKCPGRIATWIGWRIVQKYAEKTNISVQDLMKTTDHHALFGQSGYKPRN